MSPDRVVAFAPVRTAPRWTETGRPLDVASIVVPTHTEDAPSDGTSVAAAPMTGRAARTLGTAALRSVHHLLAGDVGIPRSRLGETVETADGTTFVVYRETVLRSAEDATDDGVVLVFRMQVTDPTARAPFRDALFDPVANVATPFFAGMPGFRRKLWLAGERPGEFLELYEWASADDATRFADVLRALIDPVDHAGTASFEVLDYDTVEAYVDAEPVAWRDAAPEANRPPRRTPILAGVLALGLLLAVAYALRRRGGRTATGGTE